MKVFIAGHNGMVGRHVANLISKSPDHDVLTADRADLDLCDKEITNKYISNNKPDQIIICAAKVGGILANSSNQYEFLLDNMKIQNNIFEAAKENDIKKIIFLGSSCIYPKLCPQPIKEEYLLSSSLEETNEGYALAKITGIKLGKALNDQYDFDVRALMPTNLYGAYDNFDLKNSHVMPALIRKFIEARDNKQETVEIWGTGSPLREFMHVEDLADAIKFIMELSKDEYQNAAYQKVLINVGSNEETTIENLAHIICKETGYRGKTFFNPSYPDGTPRKLMDSSRLAALEWKSKISLTEGIKQTIKWYVDHSNS